MSGFGTGSSFGGFGSNNTSGFGSGSGFGSSTGGFGSTSSPFGSGGGFGSTSGGFGSGGFGSNANPGSSLFGASKSPFGTTGNTNTGGSLFGSGNNTSSFGTGFGSGGGFGSNNNTGGSLFGGGNTSSGFGSNTGSSLFGGGGSTGFGSSTGGFGSGSGTALGGALPPAEGTANPPFSPFTEKDPNSSVTNHFQCVSAMGPYSKYSFEELRAADYNHGRRYGNGSGQPGAFGTSSFGGFGSNTNTGGGLFGSNTNTSSPFGSTNTTSSPFGTGSTSGFGNTSGSLFGGNKPATSLFGTSTGTSQPSLFSSSGTGGFGSNTGGTGTGFGSGGGLFGSGANKPSTGFGTGGGFGGFGQTTSSSSPFGSTPATASPFGGTGPSGFSGFGSANQNQTQNKPAFGFGSSTQPQQSGTSLFGSTNTNTGGGGLFGNNTQPQTGGSSLFGNTSSQPSSGGLFGTSNNQQQKPSLFGGGGFGSSTLGTGGTGFGSGGTGGGGLFGTQNQQPSGGGLFGSQPPKPGGLFGSTGQTGTNTTPSTGGSSLFGGLGSSQNQQPQGSTTGTSSLFGATQPQPQQQPQTNGLQASLLDGNPYGSQSIFSGLPAPNTPSPGPLATPLSASLRQKQRTPLPMYKVSPQAANRLITPPVRQGYGFSYSTYGTPSPPSGFNNSLLGGSVRGGSLGRSFSKSLSSSSLRKSFDADSDSILSPGAFSAGTSKYSTSSLKRLHIDRSLRTDLFSPPSSQPVITNGEETPQASKLKKRVSFNSQALGGQPNGEVDDSVVTVDFPAVEPSPEELGFLRSSKHAKVNGINETNGVALGERDIDIEQVRGNELAVVPEDCEHNFTTASGALPRDKVPDRDPAPGQYYMSPTRAAIGKMTREQQKQVTGFTVGRRECGSVTFDRPVDLTGIDLESIFDKLVKISLRSITVYPDDTDKPPQGKGLNVPSTLRIENSWPRGRDKKTPSPLTSGPLFDKHVERLRRVTNTEFVDYEKSTGTWVFKVPHFTTYGFDYDDEGESFNQSQLSAPPDTPTPKNQTPTQYSTYDSTVSIDESVDELASLEDDTFEFKKRKLVPEDSLGYRGAPKEDTDMIEDTESFLDQGSTGSASERDAVEGSSAEDSEEESVGEDGIDMAGSFPVADHPVGRSFTGIQGQVHKPLLPPDTPSKNFLDLNGNWAEQLQRTISPRKQNREALREIQGNVYTNRQVEADEKQPSVYPKESITTSIDLMNSLFPQANPKKQNTRNKGFEWPYAKKPKTVTGQQNEMSEADVAYHNSFNPRWGPFDTLICPNGGLEDASHPNSYWIPASIIASDVGEISLYMATEKVENHNVLAAQKAQTQIRVIDNVPFARLAKNDFMTLSRQVAGSSLAAVTERAVWKLCHVLFNDHDDDISLGVPHQLRDQFTHQMRKDRLSRLWEEIIRHHYGSRIEQIESPEERAFAYLCCHRIESACKTLITCRNFHLATLVSQIGRDDTFRRELSSQIQSWKESNVYSEMTEPIRALYELLAGNCLRSEGKPGGAIEDRLSTFYLSDRFDLDWIQAFGLRLWYGTTINDSIESAVNLFYRDLTQGSEPAYPFSFCVDDRKEIVSHDPSSLGLDSPLWVILKAYAVSASNTSSVIPPLDFPAALRPEAVSGDQLDSRLSFQLFHHVVSAIGSVDSVVDKFAADKLTYDFSWELRLSRQVHSALFVILHLSNATQRERAIKEILSRFAAWLPIPSVEGTSHPMWKFLTDDLHIPTAWIWAAKALHARDHGDAAGEVSYLLRAKNWNEAHETFRHTVGPNAVIEHDHAMLGALLAGFGDAPERRVRGWVTGGALYADYNRLATGRRDPTRLRRLVTALAALGERVEKSTQSSLQEKVAFREISRFVATWCSREMANLVEPSTIFNLPLTQDSRLLHTAEMSRHYYSTIMAGTS